jgi:hypothetical protein
MLNYYLLTIPSHPDWRLAYTDDNQQMYIDVSTEKGKKLITDILAEKAKFPSEYAKNLTLAQIRLATGNPATAMKGYENARKAMDLQKSRYSAAQMTMAARYPQLRKKAREYMEKDLNDFIDNKDEYADESGYGKRLLAAVVLAQNLSAVKKTTDPALAKKYQKLVSDYSKERNILSAEGKW